MITTVTDINYQISQLQLMFDEFISDNDIITFTDNDEKEYVTSEILLYNVQKSIQTSIQELELEKNDSLVEYEYVLTEDLDIFNICFKTYGILNDDNFDLLIKTNDLQGFNRTDIDPLNPMLKKGTKILYYK